MWDIIMYVSLGVIGFIMYRAISNKPIIPGIGNKKKIKTNERERVNKTAEITGPYQGQLGIKQMHTNLIELETDDQGVRTFVGAIKCEPINYALRALQEQEETDKAYERMLASISLGPGREVRIATNITSRPIELIDQIRPYQDTFPELDHIAQHYAQTLFFPFMEDWQKSVEEFDYDRYILIMIDYSPRMVADFDEETLIVKVKNEFTRLSSNVMSNYSFMGGLAEVCLKPQIIEALYFATHKKNGNLKEIRNILEAEHALSPFVMSDYSKNSYRHMEEEGETDDKLD